VIVINERSLERTLKSFSSYYHRWPTHLSLGKERHKADGHKLLTKAKSSKFGRSVACIITTNAGLPDLKPPKAIRPPLMRLSQANGSDYH